ncbi:MAG: hypothetical protein EB141_04940 [Verrucomicrobia bacterium]|nr:hypothetical protein [Pseudomonadota bacterium]NDA67939.1 hypothetical protein [Verrucomicrobiota bacterium]NDB74983.1 hypothetical protein [Verrucomicrobiota bacterium]NDD39700.1 hypothetical protein [Verrucomicrobiota bacterium]NDE99758.1 hypothetical protein [Verrucomicrobiota bacterium]
MPDLDTLIDADAEFDSSAGGFTKAKRVQSARIVTFDARKVKTACDALQTMPMDQESVHIVVSQSFAGFDLIPAFLKLTGAASYQRLYLTTLGFSRDNLAQIEVMIRAGQIPPPKLRILCGDFFRRADSGLWDIGALLAKEHGFTFKSYRNHTKLILAEIVGKYYVVESSANLRSCQNVELFTITQSKPLFQFHAGWIDEVLKSSEG